MSLGFLDRAEDTFLGAVDTGIKVWAADRAADRAVPKSSPEKVVDQTPSNPDAQLSGKTEAKQNPISGKAGLWIAGGLGVVGLGVLIGALRK